MNRYLQLLTVHSIKELVANKSFFLLIFILIAADRLVHRYVKVEGVKEKFSKVLQFGPEAATYVFENLPATLGDWVYDYRIVLVLAGMFLMKQIISLWPSSDMRRMHRRERTGFGIIKALATLRARQIMWDAIAVGSVCGAAGVWVLVCFGVCKYLWLTFPSILWLLVLSGMIGMAGPIIMAGFSYSSKIAVISRGGFGEKLNLFFKLYTSGRLLLASWMFFVARIIVESVFVLVIPAYVILTIPLFILRIAIASISATLVYSYLKMATFKFFLQVYQHYPLVQQEYANYYEALNQQTRAKP
ncbi:MAG: hypothetical protein SVY10_05680 [Thermodesulfobacteriota bacterium]|nr:hypothetical protein [Thermodesulfobacteriota bacterium]